MKMKLYARAGVCAPTGPSVWARYPSSGNAGIYAGAWGGQRRAVVRCPVSEVLASTTQTLPLVTACRLILRLARQAVRCVFQRGQQARSIRRKAGRGDGPRTHEDAARQFCAGPFRGGPLAPCQTNGPNTCCVPVREVFANGPLGVPYRTDTSGAGQKRPTQ